MNRTARWWLIGAILCACNGGSGGGSDGGGGPGTPQRLWDRQLAQERCGAPGVSIAADGTVDLVCYGSINSESGVVWKELGGTAELVAATSSVEGSPRVARDAGGGVHVVWGASGSVQYALRSGSSWTVETIATERFRPDLALAADGTPHVAFVSEETGKGMAHHAVREGGSWKIAPVHGTHWMRGAHVGVALTEAGFPAVAAMRDDGNGVWYAAADAAGKWTVEELATERIARGPLRLAVGSAGVAVAFKDDRYAAVAWRPAGSSEWSIEDASRHDHGDGPISVAVGPGGPLVVSDVDVQYPNGHALLERTSAGWAGQLLSPPHTCDGHTLTLDPKGQPAVALNCDGGVYYMPLVGTYPGDWDQRCEAAAAEMCERACTCGVDNEECCWGLSGGSTCTSRFGCPSNARGALCGDPTVSPEELQACRDELTSLGCGAAGPLDLAGACAPLYRPFAQ